MTSIAQQCAISGTILSLAGMAFTAAGHSVPVAGPLIQEAIDVAAVLNALRAAVPPAHPARLPLIVGHERIPPHRLAGESRCF
ncbi:MAG: hypothetical protein ABSB74_20255 [Tepidisphaeraceae bacterium]